MTAPDVEVADEEIVILALVAILSGIESSGRTVM
jgi:hypothetical protein